MPDLISSILKSNIENRYKDLHDSFKKEITIYKSAQNNFSIATNPFYQKQNTVVAPFTTFARVYYKNPAKKLLDGGKDAGQISLSVSDIDVEIILDLEAFNYLKGAKKIELDNNIFYIKSDYTRSGMFTSQFYHLLLSKKE